MSEGQVPTTVLVSWAHQPNAGIDTSAWRETVLNLTTGLRARGGVDADLDLFHLSDEEVDWTRWGPKAAQDSDVVIVAMNGAWAERWEGRNAPQVGAGAVAEADVLHGIFDADQSDFQRRVVVALLPGSDKSDIPHGLTRLARFEIPEPTVDGMLPLLRRLTHQPEYVPPPVGEIPVLPPRTIEALDHPVSSHRALATAIARASASGSASATSSDAADRTGGSQVKAHRVMQGDQEALRAILRSALQQLPEPPPNEGSTPRNLEWYHLQAQLSSVEAHIIEVEVESQLADRLALDSRCWLQLTLGGPPRVETTAQPVRTGDAARQWLQHWVQETRPIGMLDTSTAVSRKPGRLIFTGERTLGRGQPPMSRRWRVEVNDDGTGSAAAVVSAEPMTNPRTGELYWSGLAMPVPKDGPTCLPVRQDVFETWLLTLLELLIAHAHTVGQFPASHLKLRLLLPLNLELRDRSMNDYVGVRLVREVRDEDGKPTAAESAQGPYDPELNGPPVTVRTRNASHANTPTGRVQLASNLATQLLADLGAGPPDVLRSDGTLDELAAAAELQQDVHQHAIAIGLPADERSPLDRRQRYDELVADARAQLRRTTPDPHDSDAGGPVAP